MLTPIRIASGRQRGLSLIEVLVGIAIGLVLIGGAIAMTVTNLTNSRRMLVDARINQDLRVAADLIARDLRRAGFWANSISGVVAVGTGSTTTPNPYSGFSGTYGTASSQVTYNFARDANNTLNNNEQFGFELNNGAIRMKIDNTPTWQAVTDPSVMTVTRLQITDVPTVIPVGNMCTSGCNTVPPTPPTAPTTACPNPPAMTLRRFDILIEATSATDASVRRTLRESVRVRNEQISGACPA